MNTTFKVEKPGSHVDALLRVTQAHLVHLSSMADVKANMLLTMSSVIMTLSLPQLIKNTHLWPLIILTGFCMLTISLATYSVMPKTPFRRSTVPPDMNSPGFNLLFFGDFTRLNQAEFESAMQEMVSDHSRVYGAQVRELYILGTFLVEKKYRFLRLAYISFISGLAATFVSFLISVFG
jgi:hypothetical protein